MSGNDTGLKGGTEGPGPQAGAGARQVTIFFSDMVGFTELTDRLGDAAAAEIVDRVLRLQSNIIEQDGRGRVVKFIGDAVFAVFDTPSLAMSKAMEIQRSLAELGRVNGTAAVSLRMGMHVGEILLEEGGRLDIVSRHVNRARRVMESSQPGQILASRAVVDSGRDFIRGVPTEHLSIRYYGEYYLKGVGATELCEVGDLRVTTPQPPQVARAERPEMALMDRLEASGYRPEARIGEGAFGVVYKARNVQTNEVVAVKVLSPGLVDDEAARARLAAEAGRLRDLRFRGIARIIEERVAHDPPFLVMEYVAGRPLDVALAGAEPYRVARVFRAVCGALAEAHQRGIVHCDLKPGNVLVSQGDEPVIVDFGIAVLGRETMSWGTQSGSSTGFHGTPGYMAPEQMQGKPRTAQVDVYALGVLLFKVIAGREPFVGRSVHEVLQSQLHDDPPMPSMIRGDVPDGLQRICLKALEREPEDRYRGVGQMIEDLDRFLRGETVRSRPTLYDNLMFHRARQHVEQIDAWHARGLVNEEEKNRLVSSYEPMLRHGVPAVMEGRLLRPWQTGVYVGGWAVVNGATIWLALHWAHLSRFTRLLLGSVPVLVAIGLALYMSRLERFRLQFVAMIVCVLAVPLAAGVWLYEFGIGKTAGDAGFELLREGLTNRQIAVTAGVTAVVASVVMHLSRTTTHSAQASAAWTAFYTAMLLLVGLRTRVEEAKYATVAFWFLPCMVAATVTGFALAGSRRRQNQAAPWLYLGAFLLIGVFELMPLYAYDEWMSQLPNPQAKSYLTLSVAGVGLACLGLVARRRLAHRARLATLAVIVAGLVTILLGLYWAGLRWPWWSLHRGDEVIPLPHLLLPAASIVMAVVSARVQMREFVLIGLVGLAASLYLLGKRYFYDTQAWPAGIIVAGFVCFAVSLAIELRRTRGNATDDVVTRTRL